MTYPAPATEASTRKGDYELRYEPLPEAGARRIQRRRGSPIPRARSSCTKRAPRPMHYFPPEDVRMELPRAHRAPDALSVQRQCDLLVAQGRRTRSPRTPCGPTRSPIAMPSRFAATCRSIATRSRRCTKATRKSRSCTRAAMPCTATRSPTWLIDEAWKARSPEALMARVLRLPALRRLSDRALHRHHSHAASADLRHRARLARRCRRRAGRVRAARHPAAAAIRRQSVRADHPRRRRRAPAARGR